MENQGKPHKGTIDDWCLLPVVFGKHHIITGVFRDHPEFAGRSGHTSAVVSVNLETGEAETRNSRYTLALHAYGRK